MVLLIAAPSERFDDNEDRDRKQQQHGYFVEPAVPGMRAAVGAVFEFFQQRAACMMIADCEDDQRQLGMQPSSLEAVAEPQPDAQRERGNHQHRHEAVQLAAHQQQARGGDGLGLLRQVDEDARQVEQAGKPRGDEDDVKGFDPEHYSNPLLRRLTAIQIHRRNGALGVRKNPKFVEPQARAA